MSQQDEERREFEDWWSDLPPGYYGGADGKSAAWLAWQARARRAPEHEKAAPTVEPVAELIELNDGIGTTILSWLVNRSLFPVGTKFYASPPPVSAEQRDRLARYRRHLADWCLEARPNSDTAAIVAIARDLAALCEEVMGQTG